ncbi:MAG: LON peptidase substrate-binding domain-containing protein [Acidobacteriota bacterium]
MSRTLPLFPLPGVVLLPGTLLPLHIFEQRYRAMVADALAGDRTIGMAMLKPGWEDATEDPRIYQVGGAGEIVESEQLEDGRYNILLQARFRFRVLEESAAGPYRVARVQEVRSLLFTDPIQQSRALAKATALFGDLARSLELPPLPSESISAERLASEIALRLRYTPQELQTILETDALPERFDTLTGRMLEWKARLEFLAPFRPAEVDGRSN